MTVLQCQRCTNFWTVHTLHPSAHDVTARICPDCIPLVIPPMGLLPFPRRTA